MASRKQIIPTAGGLSGVKRLQMQKKPTPKPLPTGQRTEQVKMSTGLPPKKNITATMSTGTPPVRRGTLPTKRAGSTEGPRRRKIGIDRVR